MIVVALLAAVYAVCYVAIKSGLWYAPPLEFAGLRAGIGGAVLMLLVGARDGKILLPVRFWRGVVTLAILGTTLGFGAMFLAPGRTGAGISSVLGNTGSLFLVVLGALFLGEPLERRKVEALVLGTIGVTLLAIPAFGEPSLEGPPAALIPLAAALALAGSTVVLKRMDVGECLGRVVAWQLLLGSVPLFALSWWIEGDSPVRWTAAFVGLLAFLATVGTAGAIWTWYWLVQREDVGRLGVLMFMVPLTGLFLAWYLFDEPIEGGTLAGAALAVFAVARVGWPGTAAHIEGKSPA
ncbi:MAG: EamA family transporter [Gemmatimonadota bacterium]|nr:MAG: EamA family transporter [Gemmatimonadota bacterium]